jgi:hypothetical protein
MPVNMRLNQSDSLSVEDKEHKKPEYPTGLRIYLGPEELKKLMMDIPEVGKELDLVGKVKVVSVSEDDLKGGLESKSVTLQIVDMNLSRDKESDGELDVMKFYGE